MEILYYFLAKGLLVLNILSSPGSGKTASIEKTITDLKHKLTAGVIVGDLETDNDAKRLRIRWFFSAKSISTHYTNFYKSIPLVLLEILLNILPKQSFQVF